MKTNFCWQSLILMVS